MSQLRSYARPKLKKQIKGYYHFNRQSKEVYGRKVDIVKSSLLPACQKVHPQTTIHFTGSTANFFGTSTSDVDMCVMVGDRKEHVQKRWETKYQKLQLLRQLRNKLSKVVDNKIELIRAREPILKFHHQGFDFDLCVNNENALRNTHLLVTYAHFEQKLRPLVVVVKAWAQSRGINNASQGTFSSYALALMCVHYLQCGPGIVPSLQKVAPQHFEEPDVFQVIKSRPWSEIKNTSSSEVGLGKLLANFFEYFSQFSWNENEVCVYTGAVLSRSDPANSREQQKQRQRALSFMRVWDPFEFYNAARSVGTRQAYDQIREEFAKTYLLVKNDPCLNVILDRRMVFQGINEPKDERQSIEKEEVASESSESEADERSCLCNENLNSEKQLTQRSSSQNHHRGRKFVVIEQYERRCQLSERVPGLNISPSESISFSSFSSPLCTSGQESKQSVANTISKYNFNMLELVKKRNIEPISKTSKKTAKKRPDKTLEKTPEKTLKKMLEKTPEMTSEKIGERTLEKTSMGSRRERRRERRVQSSIGPYALFVQSQKGTTFDGKEEKEKGLFYKEVACKWKEMSEEERKVYHDQYQEQIRQKRNQRTKNQDQ